MEIYMVAYIGKRRGIKRKCGGVIFKKKSLVTIYTWQSTLCHRHLSQKDKYLQADSGKPQLSNFVYVALVQMCLLTDFSLQVYSFSLTYVHLYR